MFTSIIIDYGLESSSKELVWSFVEICECSRILTNLMKIKLAKLHSLSLSQNIFLQILMDILVRIHRPILRYRSCIYCLEASEVIICRFNSGFGNTYAVGTQHINFLVLISVVHLIELRKAHLRFININRLILLLLINYIQTWNMHWRWKIKLIEILLLLNFVFGYFISELSLRLLDQVLLVVGRLSGERILLLLGSFALLALKMLDSLSSHNSLVRRLWWPQESRVVDDRRFWARLVLKDGVEFWSGLDYYRLLVFSVCHALLLWQRQIELILRDFNRLISLRNYILISAATNLNRQSRRKLHLIIIIITLPMSIIVISFHTLNVNHTILKLGHRGVVVGLGIKLSACGDNIISLWRFERVFLFLRWWFNRFESSTRNIISY